MHRSLFLFSLIPDILQNLSTSRLSVYQARQQSLPRTAYFPWPPLHGDHECDPLIQYLLNSISKKLFFPISLWELLILHCRYETTGLNEIIFSIQQPNLLQNVLKSFRTYAPQKDGKSSSIYISVDTLKTQPVGTST